MAARSTYGNPVAGRGLANGEPMRGGGFPGRSANDQSVPIYNALRSALGASSGNTSETSGPANLDALTGATSAIQAAADTGVLTAEEAGAALEWTIGRFAESRIEKIWTEYWTYFLGRA